MFKRFLAVSLCLITLAAAAQTKKSAMKKAAPSPPDKAFLQTVWNGWASLNPESVAKYYATGPHVFFDIAPLKYNSWEEYDKGATAHLANYKSAKFTVNDDVAIHSHGDLIWVTATIAEQLTAKSGKVDMGNFRWTAVLENQDGKWIIVHEHVSAPLQ